MCLTIVVNSVFVVLCLECGCRSSIDDATSRPQIFVIRANLPLSGLPNLACLASILVTVSQKVDMAHYLTRLLSKAKAQMGKEAIGLSRVQHF